MMCILPACSESLDGAVAHYPVPPGSSWWWPFVTRAPVLQFPVQLPWEMIHSHFLVELTALLAGRTIWTSGQNAFWLHFYSNTSTGCKRLPLIAMPLTPTAPAGCCPKLTPPQLPSGRSQNVPPRVSQPLSVQPFVWVLSSCCPSCFPSARCRARLSHGVSTILL